jgi:hypothetical protein
MGKKANIIPRQYVIMVLATVSEQSRLRIIVGSQKKLEISMSFK